MVTETSGVCCSVLVHRSKTLRSDRWNFTNRSLRKCFINKMSGPGAHLCINVGDKVLTTGNAERRSRIVLCVISVQDCLLK